MPRRDMAKAKARIRCSKMTVSKSDVDAIRCHWRSLPPERKLGYLRFDDPFLTSRIYSSWENLCVADLNCFIVGFHIDDALSSSSKFGVDMFGLEGTVGENEQLLDAVFYAKESFVKMECIFQLIELRLGSPFMEDRLALDPKDWPSLFESTPNSWLDFMRQILRLVEQAILQAWRHVPLCTTSVFTNVRTPSLLPCFAKEDVNLCPKGHDLSPGVSVVASRSAKRRTRKKRSDCALSFARKSLASGDSAKVDEDAGTLCPVCDGSRRLLDSLCPLCGDEEIEESVQLDETTDLDVSGALSGVGELDHSTDESEHLAHGTGSEALESRLHREAIWSKSPWRQPCQNSSWIATEIFDRVILEYPADWHKDELDGCGKGSNEEPSVRIPSEPACRVIALVQGTFVHVMSTPCRRRLARARSVP